MTARAVDAIPIERDRRIWIFSIGKAAHPMAAAAVNSLLRSLHSVVGGIVVSADDSPSPYPTLIAMRGDHPVPGPRSFAAAAKIAEITPGRRSSDLVIVLISGGTTSLIGAPLRGMSEDDLVKLYELLLGSGLDITAMNAVRKRFSRWGAGRLALALAPATIYCFAISDVPNDDLADIGSGPCVPDETNVRDVMAILERAHLLQRIPQAQREYLAAVARGASSETPTKRHPAFAHVMARVIGSASMAADAAAARAEERGYAVQRHSDRISGEAARVGEQIARELLDARAQGRTKTCFVWRGETTVTLDPGASQAAGGRCQELALAAARVLGEAGADADGITLLAAGTDGRDGATDAAGAVIDNHTWSRISGAGADPASALAHHASTHALGAADALLPRHETGTNVADVVIAVI